MEITTKINHPSFPEFVTTIKYFDRAASIRKQSAIQRAQRPIVALDPRTGEPFIGKDGQPVIVWKADIPESFAVDSISDYVKGWSGLTLDGAEVPFSTDNMVVLLDPRLDVPVEREIEGKKQTIPQSWSSYLADKAYARATFDPDPKTTGSAKQ